MYWLNFTKQVVENLLWIVKKFVNLNMNDNQQTNHKYFIFYRIYIIMYTQNQIDKSIIKA